ncbi:MAG TPA: hypothetical protein VFV51_17245 [Vicinamibacterales bacterium]|nr:hypothetical protein [Vicinamibacterales bacterium]
MLPLLLWLTPPIARDRRAQAIVIALLAWKLFSSAALVQDGLCVRVTAPGHDGAVKNWDVRTDWRSPNPQCSAIADGPFLEERQLPIWLPFSFPEGAPQDVIAQLQMSGTITVDAPGTLRLWLAPTVDAQLTIDGRPANLDGEAITAGTHQLSIAAVLRDRNWIIAPLWNGNNLYRSAITTVAAPSTLDRIVRPWGRWITFALVTALLLVALAHTVALIREWQMLAWMIGSAIAAAMIPALVPERRWHYALLFLLVACVIRVPAALQGLRGAIFLFAPAWLALNVVDTYNDQGFGRMDFITPGNDWWAFQLYAYRIYMEGFWLQGGELAFWYQPFYRWIAGAVHLLFGQSHVGENYWDALGVLVMALFSFEAVRLGREFRWGCAAAALVLIAFVSGPGYIFIGRGLSEISSAAFIYLAALLVIRARNEGSMRLVVIAGCLAVLGTWTRLNNLPMAVAVVVFAWPLGKPASTLWQPRSWLTDAWRPALIGVPVIVAVGMALFALRTWYYTGHFSMFYGTQATTLRIWKEGMPLMEVARQMLDSVLMVATTTDPPSYHNGALPILAGFALSVAALSGAGVPGRLPLPLVGFSVAAFSGALIARGTAYSGRFSIHVVAVTVAVVVCAVTDAVNRWPSTPTIGWPGLRTRRP